MLTTSYYNTVTITVYNQFNEVVSPVWDGTSVVDEMFSNISSSTGTLTLASTRTLIELPDRDFSNGVKLDQTGLENVEITLNLVLTSSQQEAWRSGAIPPPQANHVVAFGAPLWVQGDMGLWLYGHDLGGDALRRMEVANQNSATPYSVNF